MYSYSVRANGSGSSARASLAGTTETHFTRLHPIADLSRVGSALYLASAYGQSNVIEKILAFQVLD